MVPLTYVVQHVVELPPDQAFKTEQTRMIALSQLNGATFQGDSANVSYIIKQRVRKAPGCTYMMRF